MTDKKIMTIEEVAKFLQLGIRTIYDMSRRGEIPCRKIAKQWRYDRDKVIEWVSTAESEKNEVKPQDDKKIILVVDDEEQILNILESTLEASFPDAKILTAKNGISALLTVGQYSPQIIIIDINIPKVDGLEVCKYLKNDPISSNPYIIAISGMVDDMLEKKLMDIGVSTFFKKPLQLDNLTEIVKKHL